MTKKILLIIKYKMNMENKVYVWIDQWYEDTEDVKVFKDKQKALDFAFERKKNDILEISSSYYSSPTHAVKDMEKAIELCQKRYEEGNFDYFDIRELELL